MADDPVADFLRSLNTSDRARAAAWDAVYAADDADAERRLTALPFSNEVRATLWDFRQGLGAAPLQPGATGAVPAPEAAAPADGPSELRRYAGNLGEMLNPVAMVRGIGQAVQHPIQTARGIWNAQTSQFEQAADLASEGRYTEAAGHAAAGAVPLIGPAAAAAGEQIAAGDVAGGLGRGTGLLVGALAPAAVRGATRAVRGRLQNPVPAEAEAVQWGLERGIPVDAGTATGNQALKGAQYLADRTVAGSAVATRANARQGAVLANTADDLAGRVSGVPDTAESAGLAIREGIGRRAADMKAAADTAYTRLRSIEARTPMSVDLTPVKASLQGTYEALKAEGQLTTFMSGSQKGRALVALDRLMQAPDQAPLSVADAALSELKSLARVDQSFLRTAGQGAAAKAVGALDDAVQQAARRGGRQAIQALQEGRQATVSKYRAAEVFQALPDEPVQLFNRLTSRSDTAVDLLRRVADEAPAEVPRLGRAVLEGMIEKATADGGFSRTQGLWRDWQRLGPQTKALLFQDRALIRDLDRFFLLSKKLAESPNPSGSGGIVSIGAQGVLIGTNPGLGASVQIGGAALASMLRNPRLVRLLTEGVQTPASSPQAASLAQQLTLAARLAEGVTTTADAPEGPTGLMPPPLGVQP